MNKQTNKLSKYITRTLYRIQLSIKLITTFLFKELIKKNMLKSGVTSNIKTRQLRIVYKRKNVLTKNNGYKIYATEINGLSLKTRLYYRIKATQNHHQQQKITIKNVNKPADIKTQVNP